MQAKKVTGGRGQRGQVLVLFAVTVVTMLAVAMVVIDLGFLFGQRRFDQNGADAAALAAGRMLASAVSPRDASGDETFFNVPDVEVYRVVRQYAGLAYKLQDEALPGEPYVPAYPASPYGAPTGVNQNPGLSDRNQYLAVTLEYFDGNTWCYSPSAVEPAGGWPRTATDGITTCANLPQKTLEDGTEVTFPPLPTKDKPFRVRVTVSTTTYPFVAPALHELDPTRFDTVNTQPAASTSEDVPACLRPADAQGNTACAQAVVAIKGRAKLAARGKLLPVSTGNCQIGLDNWEDSQYKLFQLWGSRPESCGYKFRSWKNAVDLSNANVWCDREPDDYAFVKLMPDGAAVDNTGLTPTDKAYCLNTDTTWDRTFLDDPDKDFVPDPGYPGTTIPTVDAPYFIAKGGFNGWVYADLADGNKVPTYGGGDLGQNIAKAFYCDGKTANDCPSLDTDLVNSGGVAPGSYFFAKDKITVPCNDWLGDFAIREGVQIGCRDAYIPAWGNDRTNHDVEWQRGDTTWDAHEDGKDSGGSPDRVRIVRLLNMRLYCQVDKYGNCSTAPGALTGDYGNSNVYGQFVSPFVNGPCPECEDGPTIYGNVAVLEK